MADQKPPTWNFHIWQIGLLVLITGAIGWQIVRPTSKTVLSAGSTQINNYEVPKVPLFGMSCMRLNASIYWQTDPKQSIKK